MRIWIRITEKGDPDLLSFIYSDPCGSWSASLKKSICYFLSRIGILNESLNSPPYCYVHLVPRHSKRGSRLFHFWMQIRNKSSCFCSLLLLLTLPPYSCTLLLLLTPAPYLCSLHLLLTTASYPYFLSLLFTPDPYSCSSLRLFTLAPYSSSLLLLPTYSLLFIPAPNFCFLLLLVTSALGGG